MIPLYDTHPKLSAQLPWLALSDCPTPVRRLHGLQRHTGASALYLKRDDISGAHYGGNKLRKLEFLLADARQQGARRVLTFGAAGSNHATATAIYAKVAGLRSISMLTRQVNAASVGRNLLASFRAEAELHHYPNERGMANAVRHQLARHLALDGVEPVVIRGGGSSPLGSVGFVNAAFELKAQIDAGELPEPARIYLPFGTTGTTAGLALGLAAAGLRSRVIAVRVVHPTIGTPARMNNLYRECNRLLHEYDASFALQGEPQVDIRGAFFGPGYARYTPEGLAAMALAADTDGVQLDGTYTAKAMAALLADLRHDPQLRSQPVLFWNTYNSRPLNTEGLDYRALPGPFHAYFERATQPKDPE